MKKTFAALLMCSFVLMGCQETAPPADTEPTQRHTTITSTTGTSTPSQSTTPSSETEIVTEAQTTESTRPSVHTNGPNVQANQDTSADWMSFSNTDELVEEAQDTVLFKNPKYLETRTHTIGLGVVSSTNTMRRLGLIHQTGRI